MSKSKTSKKSPSPKMTKKHLYIVLGNNKENPLQEHNYHILSQALFVTSNKQKATDVMNMFAEANVIGFEKRMEKYNNYNWFEKLFHSEPKLFINHFKVIEFEVNSSVDVGFEKVVWISESNLDVTNENMDDKMTKKLTNGFWWGIKLDVYQAGSPEEWSK